jgi:hypothetical protein
VTSDKVPWAKVTITPEAVEKMSELAEEVERLRALLDKDPDVDWQEMAKMLDEKDQENERLRNELRQLGFSEIAAGEVVDRENLALENERLRNLYDQADLARAQLELRVTRLRKAVNWLRGALHDGEGWDDNVHHHGTVDECTQWECQRARAVLEEET